MATYATIAAAMVAAPASTAGELLALGSTRRLAFEFLFYDGAEWEWVDATGHLLGIDVTRGAPAIGADIAAGYGLIELESPDHLFAVWNDSTDSLGGYGAQYGPGLVWRLTTHDGGTSVKPVMAGLVEQWADGADELVPSVVLTVTDTWPYMSRTSVATENLTASSDLPTKANVVGVTAPAWPFGYDYHGPTAANSTLCATAAYAPSAPVGLRLLCWSFNVEPRIDRYGKLVIGNRVTPDGDAMPGTPTVAEPVPAALDLNTFDLLVNTFRVIPDDSGMINDVAYTEVDGVGDVGNDPSHVRYGYRTDIRTDLLCDGLTAVNRVIDYTLRRAGLTQQISFELTDDHHLATILDLDLNAQIDTVLHAPAHAPVAVDYGPDCWVRRIRHRIVPNSGSDFRWSATVFADVYESVTYHGVNLHTAGGDPLNTDAADPLYTPQRNLIHA